MSNASPHRIPRQGDPVPIKDLVPAALLAVLLPTLKKRRRARARNLSAMRRTMAS